MASLRDTVVMITATINFFANLACKDFRMELKLYDMKFQFRKDIKIKKILFAYKYYSS